MDEKNGGRDIKRSWIVACLIGNIMLSCVLLRGQVVPSLRHEVLRTWTTEQGLPQNFVSAIAQTPDRFLWIGTYGGLARFDGVRFRTFEHEAPAPLQGRITKLAVDRSGALWIGTADGLFRYQGNSFQAVPLEGDGRSTQIDDLQASESSDSLLVRRGSTIFLTEGAHQPRVLHLSGLQQVRTVLEDEKGQVWALDRAGVHLFANEREVAQYPFPRAEMLYRSPEGDLFAGDGHHLFRFDGRSFVRESRQTPAEFVSLLMDRHHRLWAASGGLEGISRFADGTLETLGMPQGLASNDARLLFEDLDGDVWVGTISGLQRLHEGIFTAYTAKDGLPSGATQYDSVFADRAGEIWAGTLESGVSHFDGTRWRNMGREQGLKRGQVRGFAEDHPGPVVAISDYGLYRKSRRSFVKLPGIPAGYISSPLRTSDGSLWFSVLRKGACRLQASRVTCYGPLEGLADSTVWSLTAGPEGAIWAATQSGVFVWKSDRWTRMATTPGAAFSIALSRAGGQYYGTARGLIYQSTKSNWTLRQDDGLPSDSVLSVVEDEQDGLWVATTRGLCRLARDQLQALRVGGAHRIVPELFTEDDGLKVGGVLPLAHVLGTRSKDGQIWFATAAAPVRASVPAAKIGLLQADIERLTIDDRQLVVSQASVAPGHHRLVFAFTAPSFTAPEQMHFRYRLLGWDNAWVDAGALHEAAYMGLPPGRYAFQVQAINRVGESGPVTEGPAVTLKPFFWQTRLFLFLAICLAAAALAEVTRRRTLRQAERLTLRFQERSAERERIALQIHDTFVQDLTGTSLQLELIEMQFEQEPKLAQRSLTELNSRLREMIGRGREVISNLHVMAGPEESLAHLLQGLDREFRLSPTPTYEVLITGTPGFLHPFLRDELYRICREAVANAFRHSGANNVVITLGFNASLLRLSVRDDGAGMSHELQTQGRAGHFGIGGMKVHAQRISATLSLHSEFGVGTCVRVEVTHQQSARLMTNLRAAVQRRLLRARKERIGKDGMLQAGEKTALEGD